MKVLFDHPSPFLLAHGGFQTQIEETKRALEGLDVTVEYLRWWDPMQSADIIHFFGRPSAAYIDSAHDKNLPVAMSELLTGLGSRSIIGIALQRMMIHGVRRTLPAAFWTRMGWDSYAKADGIIALTKWEADLMQSVFGASSQRISIVPNGVSEEFLVADAPDAKQETYLVCTATIAPRKRVLELAAAAVHAQTPLWIIGKPYSETDPYAQQFFALAKQHRQIIRYEGPLNDRRQLASIYRRARGFVLLSSMESLSLSALEAAACRCPLLLSDLPWSRSVFNDNAMYCPIASKEQTTRVLRKFYDAAPSLRPKFRPLSWIEVARRLKHIYETLLVTS